jgi:hypothetical protein
MNAILPPRIPKKAKRSSRWRSQAHLAFVRSRACAMCGSTSYIEAAHVRFGSGAGMGSKPDDFLAVGLCNPCHRRQHEVGERTFWRGVALADLIEAYCKASPKRFEIEQVRKEREQ